MTIVAVGYPDKIPNGSVFSVHQAIYSITKAQTVDKRNFLC
jgi:hypothetical protein